MGISSQNHQGIDQLTKLTRLFSPVKIGMVELKNRLMMAPMGTHFNVDGFLTETTKNYIIRRAVGGVALITTEYTTVAPHSQVCPFYQGIWDDKFIPGVKELATAIHHAGAKLSVQLAHGGRECKAEVIGRQPVAPSPLLSAATGEMPRELTIAEIEELIENFGEAARRARNAGADMVEILGAQGMLIHNFMSPLANKRMDAYGGELKERVKFAVEIIRKVKEKTASSFPVIFRMVASDLVDGGLNLENAKVMAPILVDAGADALHVTAGAGFEVEYLMTPPADAGKVCIVDSVAAIKEVVDIPVIAVQRITDPLEAEEILKDGKADIICMGRALLADPDLPRKAAEGRLKDIRHCIGCCQCIDMLYHDKRLACLQNPEVGREKEYEITQVKEPKKVSVIGGGLAGMEAARIAALQGHQVTLYEKGSELGGQWILACKPPKKDGYIEVVKYIARELSRLNVRVELNRTVTPALIEESKPDVAIVATGAIPIIPEIREIDRENVITAHDVLSGEAGVGDRVVVLGGGLVGCETAHYLAERGKKVTIVEMLEELATDVGVCRKPFLFHGLSEGGVEILTSTRVKAISDGGLIAETQSNERNIGVFDTIVLALGARSVKELTEQLNRKVREVYVIGDAAEPRKAIDAIAEGSLIGREI